MSAASGPALEPGLLRVLHLEGDQQDADLVADALRKGGFAIAVVLVEGESEFERQLCLHRPDVVIANYNLPHWQGMAALDILRREGLDIPLILVTRPLGDVAAVECIKRGATDYILKDGLARLPEAVHRALQEVRLLRMRRQAELDLARKVEELSRSNADLEQFAHVASHDLQEPLRMVASYTRLLGERYRGQLDADADKFIGYACDGALRMQMLIKDLLAFSLAKRDATKCKRVDCNALIEQVLLDLGPSIREIGAKVAHGVLPVVWSESWQMARVFQNLIANAIKFRGKEPLAVSVQAEKTAEQWLFCVSDNGIGIAPQYAEKIFVPFQHLHTRAEYAGNGVGLAICKRIIEQYGGKIWVESQAAAGSTFKFTLPCDGPANRLPEESREAEMLPDNYLPS